MSACGVSSIYVRTVNDDLGALLYLIGVGDAILLNKKILANEEIPKEEVERRIGLIQMMENIIFVGIDRWRVHQQPERECPLARCLPFSTRHIRQFPNTDVRLSIIRERHTLS